MKYIAFCLLFITSLFSIQAQKLITVKGKVVDDNKGLALGLANILIENKSIGSSTDEKGRFKFQIPEGNYVLTTTYVGFENKSIELKLRRDTTLVFKLKSDNRELREVEVVESRKDDLDPVVSVQSSMIKMDQKDIEMIPTIAGENDIIKLVQLMPGVTRGIEGTGDFFVRGGDADQNLLLLDGAAIYNTGHLFGFISVFNPDVIGEATIMKGAFPSHYGGRLSSILDVRTQSTITDKTEGEGSIGLISSKIMVKTPIVSNKVGLMLSARRTYIDQVVKTVSSEVSLPYYFYDLNGRIDYQVNPKNSLYFSSYYGADVLKFEEEARNRNDGSTFRSDNDVFNNSQSFGWLWRSNQTFKMNVEAHRTLFEYNILNSFIQEKITAESGIEDYGLSVSFQKDLKSGRILYFGASTIHHEVKPISFTTTGIIASILPGSRSDGKGIWENALYAEISEDLSSRLRVRLGYRQSFGVVDQVIYPGFEPRLAMRYTLNEYASFKLSYSRMSQYLHRVSSSSITLPVDLWYTATANIKPQSSDQFTIGYAWKHKNKQVVLETDIYFKDMHNLTEYQPGTTLLFNANFEDALLQGEGTSYGWEIMVRKEGEKLHGWISYSLGWSFREFEELNESNPFNATYDRRHNGAIVLQYNIYKRWAISGVWEFISGSRFTPVIGQYAVVNPVNTGVDVVNIYSGRNDYTLSNTHRLDLMLILKSKEKRRFQGEWRFGVYNIYNRASPVQVYVQVDDNGNYEYVQPGLFGALPFVSYHFKF